MKNHINLFLFLILFNLTFTSSADNFKKDSLKKVLVSVTSDTVKINILNELAVEYMKVSPEFSDSLLNKAKLISEKINNYNYIAKTYFNIGLLNRYQNNYYKAFEFTKMAQKIYANSKNVKGTAQCLGSIGVIYMEQGDYPLALDNYFNSLKIYDDLNYEKGIAYTYSNIGIVYNLQENFDRAIDYFLKSLKINRRIDQMNGVAKVCNLLGTVYNKKSKYEDAGKYYNMSLKISQQLNDKLEISFCYENIAESFLAQGNFEKALDMHQQSMALREDLGHKSGIAKSLLNIGKLYLFKKENLKAVQFFNKSIEIAEKINSLELLRSNYEYLSETYIRLNDYKKAYNYLSLNRVINDTIFNIEKTRKFSQLEMNYMFEKKKHQLEIKQKQKEAIELIAQNKQKIIRNAFICGFLLMLVLVFVIFRSYRQKKRANILLVQQKEEISSQRDEIETQRDLVTKQKEHIEQIHEEQTDSIRYAERIQNAVLPVSESARSILGEHFVLFKPKDIVSGDFYFVEQRKNILLISVADCTGHGVPGAFMSMLGISFLNEIIAKEDIQTASLVLDELRQYVIISLQQKGIQGEQQDGMDIAFIALNTETNQLQFAGANNPLYYIPVESNEIITIKADTMPVGIYGDMKPFNNNIIQVNKGDRLYIFSDGFIDQFGGENHKKFLSKRFKESLLQINHLPMHEQKENLNNIFENWKGNSDQIDDVTVLGIKI